MRISDWSSDVCSSDLAQRCAKSARGQERCITVARRHFGNRVDVEAIRYVLAPEIDRPFVVGGSDCQSQIEAAQAVDQFHRSRKRVVEGTSVLVRVDICGGRLLKTKK